MENLIRESVRNIKPYIPGKPIEEVKRELGIVGEVDKLASNENPLGPSPLALEAVKNSILEMNLYPDDANFYLKNKLAEILGILPEELFIGNGSVEIIHYVTLAFLNPSERVIMAKPSFIMGKIESQIMDGEIVEVPVKDYKADVDGIISKINGKTKIIYIDNPNNPLGSMLTDKEVNKIIESVGENILVILDEAYYEYIEREDFPKSLKYVQDNRNVLVLRTFSKIYGLAGMRIGYGIAKKDIIDALSRVRLPFNVGRFSQIAALAALDDNAHREHSKRIVKEGKAYLYREFENMNIPYIKSETNFVTIDVKRDTDEIFFNLQKNGIIVRPLKPYGLPTFLRITVGLPEQNRRFIDLLKNIEWN